MRRQEQELGIASIDEQHHVLMGLLNAFQTAILSRRPPNDLRAVADLGLEYLKAHFANEEELAATSGYPQAAEHRFQHQHLLLNAEALAKDALSGCRPPEVQDENVELLRQMFLHHVTDDDLALAAHLKQHRLPPVYRHATPAPIP